MEDLTTLLREVRACTICAEHLPAGPRPIVAAHAEARILIVGQAPGSKVHATGVPWDDPSGKRLRAWLDVTDEEFYDPARFALVPMGFCYPGRGSSGDLPPRVECAETWHARLLATMPRIRTTILLSRYALDRYLGDASRPTLTDTVKAWREFAPTRFPLPHPSPRNNRWLVRNPWFEADVLPTLRRVVREALD